MHSTVTRQPDAHATDFTSASTLDDGGEATNSRVVHCSETKRLTKEARSGVWGRSGRAIMASVILLSGLSPASADAADPMSGSEGWLGELAVSSQVSGFGAKVGYARGHQEVRVGAGGMPDAGFGAAVEYRVNIWPIMFLDEHAESKNAEFTLKIEGLPPGASMMLMPFASASIGATPNGNTLGLGPALTGGVSIGIGSRKWPVLGALDLSGGKAYDFFEGTWEPAFDVGFTIRPAMNRAAHDRVAARKRKSAETRAAKRPKYEYVEVPAQTADCGTLRRASQIEMQQIIAQCMIQPYEGCANKQGPATQAYQKSGCMNEDIQRQARDANE